MHRESQSKRVVFVLAARQNGILLRWLWRSPDQVAGAMVHPGEAQAYFLIIFVPGPFQSAVERSWHAFVICSGKTIKFESDSGH